MGDALFTVRATCRAVVHWTERLNNVPLGSAQNTISADAKSNCSNASDTHTDTHTQTHTYIYIHKHLHTYIYTHTSTHMSTPTHTSTHTHKYTHIPTHTSKHTYMYTHKPYCIHTYTRLVAVKARSHLACERLNESVGQMSSRILSNVCRTADTLAFTLPPSPIISPTPENK